MRHMMTMPATHQGVWHKRWFVEAYGCAINGGTSGSLSIDRRFIGRAALGGQQWVIRPQPFGQVWGITAAHLFLVEREAPKAGDPVVELEAHRVRWNAQPLARFQRHSWRASAWETADGTAAIQFSEQWWNADIRVAVVPTADIMQADLLVVLGIYHIALERLNVPVPSQ